MRSTTQIWVVTRHQYGISVLVSQTSFGGKTSGSVANVGCFLGLPSLVCICCLLHIYGHIYAYSSECYLQRHYNRSQTLGLRSVHLTNSHLQISDLESYETTNLETQNYAESACENHGEIVKQLIGSEKKPKYQISLK